MNLNHFRGHPDGAEAALLCAEGRLSTIEVSIHPPFTDIRSVQTLIESEDLDSQGWGSALSLGRQRCVHWRSERRSSWTS